MKRISILAACFSLTVSAMSQSFVDFNANRPFATPADRRVYLDFVGGTPLVGTNWVAQLYFGADPDSLIAHTAAPTRFRAPDTIVPGTWIGGTRSLSPFAPGTTVTLQVRVWDISLFSTFEAAAAGGGIFGVSSPFQYTIPSGSPPPPPPAFFIENFRAFALNVPNQPPVAVIDPPAFFQLFPDSTDPVLLSINGLDATVMLDSSHSIDASPLQFSWFETDANDPFALSAVATHAFAVGEHTVTLVVSDGELSDSESLSFEVFTLSQAIDLIILAVENTDLGQGPQTALINSLEAAAEAFQEGDYDKGLHKLEVFLSKVEDEVAPIDLALAQYLSFAAEALISAVETSGVIP